MGKSFVVGVLALDSYLLYHILPTCRVGDKSRDCWYGVNKAAGIAVALWIFSFVPDAAKIFSGLLVE